jgi:hypothetical protein
VFQPRSLVGVLAKVLVRDVVMLADDYPAQAREVAFPPVRVLPVIAVGERVIDALDRPDAG